MSKASEKAKKADERRRLFAKHYVIHMNAKAAAEAAGSEAKDLAQAGYELLCHADTQRYIEEERERRAKRTEVTQDKVIRELARIAFADQRHFAEWGPDGVKLRDSSELTTDQARAIAEVSETFSESSSEKGSSSSFSRKLKLHSKTRALELLGQHLGMFKTTVDVPGLQTLADLVVASMEMKEE